MQRLPFAELMQRLPSKEGLRGLPPEERVRGVGKEALERLRALLDRDVPDRD